METTTIISTPTLSVQKPTSYQTHGSFNYYNGGPVAEDDYSAFIGQCPHIQKVTLPVHDIRPNPSLFTLQTHGFQLLSHQSAIVPSQSDKFYSDDFVKARYWPEMRSFLKENFNARSVFIQNTTVRDASRTGEEPMNPNEARVKKQAIKPFFIVHGDYTPAGARSHLHAMLPTFFEDNDLISTTTSEERETYMSLRGEIVDAEEKAMEEVGASSLYEWDGSNYSGPRYAIFSIWRPLATIQRDPLAIMDWRDLGPDHIAEATRNYLNRSGFEPSYKVQNVLARPPTPPPDKADIEADQGHRWYWISEQKPDEVWALKLFDSDASTQKGREEGVAKMAAHSAFELEGSEQKEQRRSCELRVIVIW